MGSGRGGVYTYDWIENLFGLGMRSADEILPQFQDVKLGDEFQLGPGRPKLRVEVLDPGVRSDPFRGPNWVWIFALFASRSDQAAEQEQDRHPPRVTLTRLFSLLVMEPGSLVMERKMLLGIKQRAERLAIQREAELVAR